MKRIIKDVVAAYNPSINEIENLAKILYEAGI
jgi:hypothetical protein